ncbi:MAG: pilus assembly protein PilM, partial [Planctomycetales bacterium]|nr:pilus assembly protein PilM [Planctomycetales bacterium]
YLERTVRNAPLPLPYVETCIRKWAKLRANDPQIAKHLQTLQTRRKKLNSTVREVSFTPANEHSAAKPDTRIVAWHGIGEVAGAADQPQLKHGAQRFHVAYGLALQGLGLSKLAINLMPKSSGGLLQKFKSLRRTAPPSRVWGIDIGSTGVKAIELSLDQADKSITITAAKWIPHANALGDAIDQEASTSILKQTLAQFHEEVEAESIQAVLGFSGPRTLGRWFEIPGMDAKKSADAVAYEARMQIPIPIEDINFDWHRWPKAEGDERAFQNVILLAARKDHIAQQLDLVADLPIQVVGVQSICLALYNAAVHELFPKPVVPAESDDNSATDKAVSSEQLWPTLGILELGAESSNFVAVGNNFVRYRSMPVGTHRLDRELMKQLRLTRDKSSELRQRPERARCLYQVEQIVRDVYEELLNDLRRTLRAYETDGVHFDKIVITGGGIETLGVAEVLATQL